MALRTDEARSRRDLGTFALNDFGILIRVIGESGPSTSWTPIRRSWLSKVMTAGRGSREWWSELSTTARPGARPLGTSTTSPGSSRLRESSVRDFLARELLLEALFSASERARRSRAYSVKSPRWQVIALLKPARDSSRLLTCLASPTTERSAWNWANEDSRISRARGRPNWASRLMDML
jgi:hypothetical protein